MNLIGILKNNTSTAKNLSLYLVSSLLASLIGVAFNPFLAANLSSVDYSIIGYYSSFTMLFLPILNFSFISFYVRKYFKMDDEKRRKTCDTIVAIMAIWGSISSILILSLFYVYTVVTKIEIPFFPYAVVFIAQLFFNNFILLYQVNCRMKRDARKYFKLTIASSIATVLFSVLLVIIFKFGAVGRMSAMLLSTMIFAIYSIQQISCEFKIDWLIVKEALVFGWPISCAAILQFFLAGIDISFLARLNDVENMGLFVVAASVVGYLSIIHTSLGLTLEPDIYKAVADYDYRKIVKIIVLISLIILIVIFFFMLLAKPIVAILTYGRYTEAYGFARVLSIGVLTTYIMTALDGVINAFGFTKIGFINKIIATGLSVLLYYILIHNFGFYGAAWGRVAAPMIVALIGIFALLMLKGQIKKMRYEEKN